MSEWTECHSSVTYALLVPVVYVGLTRLSSYDVPHWDRHRTILRRFVGASFASILLSIVALRWKPENQSALEFFGLRRPGLFLALILPTSVTAVLFLGPWCLSLFVGPPSDDDEEDSFVMLLRNYLLAPLTEELVFRCCALRVMTMCMSWTKACLISPLSFAFAHCHHALEKKRLGYNWQDILCTVGTVSISIGPSVAARPFRFPEVLAFEARLGRKASAAASVGRKEEIVIPATQLGMLQFCLKPPNVDSHTSLKMVDEWAHSRKTPNLGYVVRNATVG